MGNELSKSKAFHLNLVGALQMAGGCLLTSVCGVVSLVQLLWAMMRSAPVLSLLGPGGINLIYFLGGCAGGVGLISLAVKNFMLVSRAKKLVRLANDRSRGTLDLQRLALGLGRRQKETLRDIKKMIRKDILPTAVLDLENNTLSFEERWEGPRILPKNKKEKLRLEEPEQISTGDQDLDEVLTKGQAHMTHMSELSLKIANRTILDQIQEIMNITGQIFGFIRKNPAQIRQIRQFTSYYLPTTVKLLSDYEEMSRQSFKGENLTDAMKKIEDIMEKIKETFQNELDHLFSDKAMDVSVDIDVMEQIMRNENLNAK
jgi:5-bromo-4-chloroindolyl phosphate hydrolysis protein